MVYREQQFTSFTSNHFFHISAASRNNTSTTGLIFRTPASPASPDYSLPVTHTLNTFLPYFTRGLEQPPSSIDGETARPYLWKKSQDVIDREHVM
jgi:hypothetical protein